MKEGVECTYGEDNRTSEQLLLIIGRLAADSFVTKDAEESLRAVNILLEHDICAALHSPSRHGTSVSPTRLTIQPEDIRRGVGKVGRGRPLDKKPLQSPPADRLTNLSPLPVVAVISARHGHSTGVRRQSAHRGWPPCVW